MKKTIKRGVAVILYNMMAKMSFSHLSEETIEAVMDNFMALGKVAEGYQKMLDEMNKRLLEGISKDILDEYNEKTQTMTEEELEKSYPTICPIARKQKKVADAIFNKDIEIELNEVEKEAFVKAVMKGTPNLTVGILENFGIMFKEEKKEDDFSELDELMKD